MNISTKLPTLNQDGYEWNRDTTKLVDALDNFIECKVTECCKRGPIISENYCPNCGRKIVRKWEK